MRQHCFNQITRTLLNLSTGATQPIMLHKLPLHDRTGANVCRNTTSDGTRGHALMLGRRQSLARQSTVCRAAYMGDDILSTRSSISGISSSYGVGVNRANLCRDEVCDQAVKEGYNAADNAEYWQTRPVPVIARCLRIASEVLRWKLQSSSLGSALLGSGGGGPEASPALLLQALIRLGPAFVKIGQALSSRPDVLPPEFQRELEKLQDQIPPFPTVEAFISECSGSMNTGKLMK